MKKLMLFLAVTVLLTACGNSSTETVGVDSTVVKNDSIVKVDSVTVDSTKLVK